MSDADDVKVLDFPEKEEREVLETKTLTINVDVCEGGIQRPRWDMEGMESLADIVDVIALLILAMAAALSDKEATKDERHELATLILHEIHYQYARRQVLNDE